MSNTAIVAGQTIAVGVLVFLGQWVVARLSKKANEETVEVDAQEKATKAWQDYAHEMKERLDQLEKRLAEAEAREEENRRRIRALEGEARHDKDLIRRLVIRLRWAMNEIKRLGGTIPDEDFELAEAANLHLDGGA